MPARLSAAPPRAARRPGLSRCRVIALGTHALPENQFCWASVFVGKSTQAIEESIRLRAPRVTSPGLGLTLERRRLSS